MDPIATFDMWAEESEESERALIASDYTRWRQTGGYPAVVVMRGHYWAVTSLLAGQATFRMLLDQARGDAAKGFLSTRDGIGVDVLPWREARDPQRVSY